MQAVRNATDPRQLGSTLTMMLTRLLLAVARSKRHFSRRSVLTGLLLVVVAALLAGLLVPARRRSSVPRSVTVRGSVPVVSVSAPPKGGTCNGYNPPGRLFLNTSSADRYVSLCKTRMYGNHRLGNHLFMLAALLHVSELTNRVILMKPGGWCLDEPFQLNCVLRYGAKSTLPRRSRVLRNSGRYPQSLDTRLNVVNGKAEVQNYVERTVELCGLYQTTVYADAVEAKLRRMLQYKPHIRTAAESHLAAACPKARSGISTHVCIGVHVRRGDFLDKRELMNGITIVTDVYLRKAMEYYIDRYAKVQFVIAGDDPTWVRKTLKAMFPRSVELNHGNTIVLDDNVLATLSVNQSAAVDFAMLTMCDGLVISTGSFGWWAAWLANKTTVYYANWPRKNSLLGRRFDSKNYFPRKWIPMT